MRSYLKYRILGVFIAQMCLALAHASPQHLTDQELSDVSGQAFLSLNNYNNDGLDITRVNLGAKIDMQFNAKELKVGEYQRKDAQGNVYGRTSDLYFQNVAFGDVTSTGGVNAFTLNNPYIEFAYKGNTVVGLRLALGEALGSFSGVLSTFTGNFNFGAQGTGAEFVDFACHNKAPLACGAAISAYVLAELSASKTPAIDSVKFGLSLADAGIVGSAALAKCLTDTCNLAGLINTVSADAADNILGDINKKKLPNTSFFKANGSVVYGEKDAGPNGSLGTVRSGNVGLVNGGRIFLVNADGTPKVAGLDGALNTVLSALTTKDCQLLGLKICFPNTSFESFYIGNKDTKSPAKDIFLSLQSQSVSWLNSDGTKQVATPGAFFNVPGYVNAAGQTIAPVNVNFSDLNGLPRLTTCFGPLVKGITGC